MAKAKEKEFDATREWNDFVWSLIQAERAWKRLSNYFLKAGNLDDISEEWASHVIRICRTTRFRHAIEDFMQLCGVRGSAKDYLIKTKKMGD